MSGNGVIVVGAINVDFVVATDRQPGPVRRCASSAPSGPTTPAWRR